LPRLASSNPGENGAVVGKQDAAIRQLKPGLFIKIVQADAYAGLLDVPPCLPKQLVKHILAPDPINHSTWKIVDCEGLPPYAILPFGARVLRHRRGRNSQIGS